MCVCLKNLECIVQESKLGIEWRALCAEYHSQCSHCSKNVKSGAKIVLQIRLVCCGEYLMMLLDIREATLCITCS